LTRRVQLAGVGVRIPAGGRYLVRALDLAIDGGSIVAVIGPSGAGKTTLLRAVAGLDVAAEGSISLDGRRIDAWHPRERARRIAWLPQRADPWVELAARDIVGLGRTPLLGALAALDDRDREAIDAALAATGTTALAERRMSTLSGGERQRVMLARMVASGARLLVLDEPTASLDVGHALRVLQTCRALATGGAAVVFATHDVELAERFADVVVCLGEATTVGTPADVLVPEILGPLYGVRASWSRRIAFELP
jgi:iron complex transport system ATP-binding protein